MNKIKELRKENNITVAELAKELEPLINDF